MRCEYVRKQLTAFCSGELSPDVYQAVQSHLAKCLACRAALTRIDVLSGVLASAQMPPVPPGFATRIMAAVRQQQAEHLPDWNLLRWWQLTSAPMHAAAVAVLVIGLTIGLMIGPTTSPSNGQTETSAPADPVAVYDAVYLYDAPAGSLADSYLSLVVATNEGGRR
jgi:anti-sigma factor RsiW